jgi:hypothetical protein
MKLQIVVALVVLVTSQCRGDDTLKDLASKMVLNPLKLKKASVPYNPDADLSTVSIIFFISRVRKNKGKYRGS